MCALSNLCKGPRKYKNIQMKNFQFEIFTTELTKSFKQKNNNRMKNKLNSKSTNYYL